MHSNDGSNDSIVTSVSTDFHTPSGDTTGEGWGYFACFGSRLGFKRIKQELCRWFRK